MPTRLESMGRRVNVNADVAQAAASDATSVAQEVYARLDADAAEEAADTAAAAAQETITARKNLEAAVYTATNASVGAMKAAQQSERSYQLGALYVSHVGGTVAGMVSGEVAQQTALVYKKLQDWKMAVLHDPVREGRAAGLRAAQPFERALQVTERRAGAYAQRATALSNEARSLRARAVGLSNSAVGQQASGDVFSAAANMKAAHQMAAQAAQFDAQGSRLQRVAKDLAARVPAYTAAAGQAAQDAMHRYAPDVFAPPAVASAAMPPVDV